MQLKDGPQQQKRALLAALTAAFIGGDRKFIGAFKVCLSVLPGDQSSVVAFYGRV